MTPEPSQRSQIWWRCTPSAERRKPPPQQNAATTPALRGPACSSQRPKTAAEEPRKTKNSVYIQPSVLIFQSQCVVTARWRKLIVSGQATGWVMPMAWLSGSQKTLKPYAMPMERWMARAAGGTSQRLNPGPATIRSLESSPAIAILLD